MTMLKPVELKNGLKILRIPKPSTDVFTVGMVVHTGTANEKNNFPAGISNLIERMFWAGTDKHPSTKSLNLYLESIGGRFASLTTHETMHFYISVPSKNQFKAISFLSEVFQNSFFDSKHLEKHKQNIILELKDEQTHFEKESQSLGFSNIYSNYGIGQSVSGEVETVLPITQEDILDFISSQLNPRKMYLILAGDFETKSATDLTTQEWSGWNPSNGEFKELEKFYPEKLNLPSVIYKQRGINQTQINIGFILDRGMDIFSNVEEDEEILGEDLKKDPETLQDELLTDWAKMLVLNTILGKGYSSRLWSKGVEEEMFFYNLYSELHQFSKTSTLEINGFADNTHFTFALESILSVIDSLKKTTVSINELAKAKEFLKGSLILDQEENLASVVWQIQNLLSSGLTFEVRDLLQKIDTVEAKEIRNLAENVFTPERLYVTTFGPAKETRLVEKLIRKYIGEF